MSGGRIPGFRRSDGWSTVYAEGSGVRVERMEYAFLEVGSTLSETF